MNPYPLSLSKSRASTGSARTVLMPYSGLNRTGAISVGAPSRRENIGSGTSLLRQHRRCSLDEAGLRQLRVQRNPGGGLLPSNSSFPRSSVGMQLQTLLRRAAGATPNSVPTLEHGNDKKDYQQALKARSL